MSRKIFEAHFFDGTGQYRTHESGAPDDAIEAVEAAGSGSVTLFLERPNLPHCKPDMVQSSLAHWRYEGGKWESISIFTGRAEAMAEEKPHL